MNKQNKGNCSSSEVITMFLMAPNQLYVLPTKWETEIRSHIIYFVANLKRIIFAINKEDNV